MQMAFAHQVILDPAENSPFIDECGQDDIRTSKKRFLKKSGRLFARRRTRPCCNRAGDSVRCRPMDSLTLFGLFSVTAMMVCYALESRSHWFVLAFAGTCVLASTYGFLQGAWPFGVVEAVWSLVALARWRRGLRRF